MFTIVLVTLNIALAVVCNLFVLLFVLQQLKKFSIFVSNMKFKYFLASSAGKLCPVTCETFNWCNADFFGQSLTFIFNQLTVNFLFQGRGG